MLYDVLVLAPFTKSFTYKYPKKIKLTTGDVVEIPFGKRKSEIGLIVNTTQANKIKYPLKKIKEIKRKISDVRLDANLIKFVSWVSDYNLYPKGIVLKMVLPKIEILDYKIKNESQLKNEIKNKNELTKTILNKEQKEAYLKIKSNLIKNHKVTVLEGVTGSGKTEVYFECIKDILKNKKQVLILLPEISLTPDLKYRFISKFGFEPAIWHSKISQKIKRNIWHNCYSGKSKIIVGARSSLFLPFKNLGLIIVDEEHDISYKQEDGVRYHARDMAIVRSKIEKIPIVLSTATPSLETFYNIIKKKYERVFLSKQYSGSDLSRIHIIDLKKQKLEKNIWISDEIIHAIKKSLDNKKQSLIFLNRRGYAPLTICSNCGDRIQCDYCSAWLVMHNKKFSLSCHHCGFTKPFIDECYKCKEKKTMRLVGPGIERVAEEVKNKFPKAKVEILSSENMNTNKKIESIINKIKLKEVDIMVGTQILAKGHNFPSLSLVAVIDSDSGLKGGDLRASEHTYNLLEQVGGRAGRTDEVGDVYIQTYFTSDPIIESIKTRDRRSFLKNILSDREKFNLPPFSQLIAIVVSGPSKGNLVSFINKILKEFPKKNNIKLMGPAEAPIFLLRGRYRYRILLSSSNRRELNQYVQKWLKNINVSNNIRVTPDVDPYSFM